jgi:hypothetical protein
MAFSLGIVAVATTSLIGVRALDVTGHVRMVLAWALLTCAQMVAAVEILSLVRAVTVPGLLTLHVGVTVLVARARRTAGEGLPAGGRARAVAVCRRRSAPALLVAARPPPCCSSSSPSTFPPTTTTA